MHHGAKGYQEPTNIEPRSCHKQVYTEQAELAVTCEMQGLLYMLN